MMGGARKSSVYLAGPSKELARVRRYAAALDDSGVVQLAYRWWIPTEGIGLGNDARLPIESQASYAAACRAGVWSADVVWILWPDVLGHSEGAPVEMGMADAWQTSPVVVTGTRAHECIFTALADYRDSSDDLGLLEVVRLADEVMHRKCLGDGGD